MWAFNELGSHRMITAGFGIVIYNEIPVLDIEEYGRRRGLMGEALRLFVFLVRQLDDEYRTWHNAEQERQRNAPKGEGEGPKKPPKPRRPRMRAPRRRGIPADAGDGEDVG